MSGRLARLRDWRRARPARLELLVLAVADRCDQRCLHCDIWQGTGAPPLTLEQRLRVVEEALAAGARQALLTGGEPLLSSDLWPVAARLKAAGARVMLATNGMQLARWAARVAELCDEVYLSLDGPDQPAHDRARGAAAFSRLREGVAALRAAAGRVRVVTRTTLHALNVERLEEMVEAARALGADAASFLALDASSSAFGGPKATRAALVPAAGQLPRLQAAIDRLAASGVLGRFVLESEAKLRALAAHLRATGGLGVHQRPRCDAPWWSVVVEADGRLRPCFFQPAVGDVAGAGLAALRGGPAYRQALRAVRAENATCERCVCPKWRGRAAAGDRP